MCNRAGTYRVSWASRTQHKWITYSIVLHTELVSQCILDLRRINETAAAQQRPETTNSTTLITISGTHRTRVVPWEERERGACLLRACSHMITRFDDEWPICATISATVLDSARMGLANMKRTEKEGIISQWWKRHSWNKSRSVLVGKTCCESTHRLF